MVLKKSIVFVLLICSCFIDDGRAQTAVSNIDESKVPPYTLPDVLKMKNGKEVRDQAEWNNIQRPYIYHLYEEDQFGAYPVTKIHARYRLLKKEEHALGGKSTRKQVRIYLHPTDTSVYTDVLLY